MKSNLIFWRRKDIYRGDDQLYLKRLTIFQCSWFSVKLHKILLSDDDCPHDHPWSFLTFILKGGYVEHSVNGRTSRLAIKGGYPFSHFSKSKLYGAGSLLYRPANFIHRLDVYQPTTTLVITFKKVKSWGFFTPSGFVEWFKYRSSGSRCE